MSGSRKGKQPSVSPLTESPTEPGKGTVGWIISHMRRSRAAQTASVVGAFLVAVGVYAFNAVHDDAQRALVISVAGVSGVAVGGMYFAYRTLKLARHLSAEGADLRNQLHEIRDEFSKFQKAAGATSSRHFSAIHTVSQRSEALINQRIAELLAGQAGLTHASPDALQNLVMRLDRLERAGDRRIESQVSELAESVAAISRRLEMAERTTPVQSTRAASVIERTDEFSKAIKRGGDYTNIALAAMQEQVHLISSHLAQLELALASKASVQALARIEHADYAQVYADTPDILREVTARLVAIEAEQERLAARMTDEQKADPEILSRLAIQAANFDERMGRIDPRLASLETTIDTRATTEALARVAERQAHLVERVDVTEKAIAERIAALESDFGATKVETGALCSSLEDLRDSILRRADAADVGNLVREFKVLSAEQIKAREVLVAFEHHSAQRNVQLEGLAQKSLQHETRLAAVDQQFARHSANFADFADQIASKADVVSLRNAEQRLSVIAGASEAARASVGDHFVLLEERLERTESAIGVLKTATCDIGKLSREAAAVSSRSLGAIEARLEEQAVRNATVDKRLAGVQGHLSAVDGRLAGVEAKQNAAQASLAAGTANQEAHANALSALIAGKADAARLHSFEKKTTSLFADLDAVAAKHDQLVAVVEAAISDGQKEIEAIAANSQAIAVELASLSNDRRDSEHQLLAVSQSIATFGDMVDSIAREQARTMAQVRVLEANLEAGLAEGEASVAAIYADLDANSLGLAHVNDLLKAVDGRLRDELDTRSVMSEVISEVQSSLSSVIQRSVDADTRIVSIIKLHSEANVGLMKLQAASEGSRLRFESAEARLEAIAQAQAEAGRKFQSLNELVEDGREKVQRLNAQVEALSTATDVSVTSQTAQAELGLKEPNQKVTAETAGPSVQVTADHALIKLHERRKRIATLNGA